MPAHPAFSAQPTTSKRWIPKISPHAIVEGNKISTSPVPRDPTPSSAKQNTSHPKPLEASPPSSSTLPLPMANFAVDPCPHVPSGFQLLDVEYLGLPDRPRVFLSTFPEKNFEQVAIATFAPPVNKRDFNVMARELRRELYNRYRTPDIEVQPSAIGDAFVTFHSPMERQRFINGASAMWSTFHSPMECSHLQILLVLCDALVAWLLYSWFICYLLFWCSYYDVLAHEVLVLWWCLCTICYDHLGTSCKWLILELGIFCPGMFRGLTHRRNGITLEIRFMNQYAPLSAFKEKKRKALIKTILRNFAPELLINSAFPHLLVPWVVFSLSGILVFLRDKWFL